jgi:hypothetical protein
VPSATSVTRASRVRWLASLVLFTACASQQAPKSSLPKPAAPVARAGSVPVHERGHNKLIAAIGSAGGTLELDNGARLEIPAGALSETVEITFAEGAHTTAFANHEHERALGTTLEVAPELVLSAPARVSIPATHLPEGFAESDLTLGLEVVASNQRGVQMQGTQTRWDYLPAVSEHGRAVAELGTVPGLRLQFLVSKSE